MTVSKTKKLRVTADEGQYQDLLAAWQCYQHGTENPFDGSYGQIVDAQLYCYQQLYRLIWHGWDPLKEGLGSMCPESPGELLELLVTPSTPLSLMQADEMLAAVLGILKPARGRKRSLMHGNIRLAFAEFMRSYKLWNKCIKTVFGSQIPPELFLQKGNQPPKEGAS
jgi:hypothetical protein